MTAPLLRLAGVSKRFGGVVAVDRITLDVEAGEFLTVLGASGSGKTTTLRLIAGFDQPTTGQILMEGADLAGLPPYRRDVNTVFQHYALFPHLTVRQNVAYGLRMRGVPEAERERRVAEGLALVQLEALGARKPSQLSGGQQQRVALARALVNQPKILLLDEPLGALDLKLRQEMQLELKHLQTRLGITFVYVTHDQEEALTMSDRIALMRQGRIEQVATPGDLYHRPRTRYVADFIGATNLLKGRVRETPAGLVLLEAPAGLLGAALDPSEVAPAPGTEAWIALRPERCDLLAAGPAPGGPGDAGPRANVFEGTVTDVVFAGAARKVYVTLVDGTRLVVTPPRDAGLAPGVRVGFSWPVEAGVLLRE